MWGSPRGSDDRYSRRRGFPRDLYDRYLRRLTNFGHGLDRCVRSLFPVRDERHHPTTGDANQDPPVDGFVSPLGFGQADARQCGRLPALPTISPDRGTKRKPGADTLLRSLKTKAPGRQDRFLGDLNMPSGGLSPDRQRRVASVRSGWHANAGRAPTLVGGKTRPSRHRPLQVEARDQRFAKGFTVIVRHLFEGEELGRVSWRFTT